MIRVLAFITLLILALMAPVWIFILCAAGYAFFLSPYEPIGCAILIDAQFAEVERGFPYLYTALVLAAVAAARLVRPRMRL